jgi:hypothetical protein
VWTFSDTRELGGHSVPEETVLGRRQLSRLGRIFADGRRIDRALKMAARVAIREYELHDAPVVIWRDGHVAWVPAS